MANYEGLISEMAESERKKVYLPELRDRLKAMDIPEVTWIGKDRQDCIRLVKKLEKIDNKEARVNFAFNYSQFSYEGKMEKDEKRHKKVNKDLKKFSAAVQSTLMGDQLRAVMAELTPKESLFFLALMTPPTRYTVEEMQSLFAFDASMACILVLLAESKHSTKLFRQIFKKLIRTYGPGARNAIYKAYVEHPSFQRNKALQLNAIDTEWRLALLAPEYLPFQIGFLDYFCDNVPNLWTNENTLLAASIWFLQKALAFDSRDPLYDMVMHGKMFLGRALRRNGEFPAFIASLAEPKKSRSRDASPVRS